LVESQASKKTTSGSSPSREGSWRSEAGRGKLTPNLRFPKIREKPRLLGNNTLVFVRFALFPASPVSAAGNSCGLVIGVRSDCRTRKPGFEIQQNQRRF